MTEQEMQEYFPKVYPKMFVGKYGGIAVGAGWANILVQLCQNIQHHLDWKNKDGEIVPQVVVQQVKEKFGSLRFYYQGGDEYVAGLVSMAESMSGVTCESCGVPGETRRGGWIRVLCQSCENSREEAKLLREGFEQ
jgi:hypothetical protein